MGLTVRDVLRLDILRQTRAVAGAAGLDRDVRWVHIWPEVLPWFHGGELLLTTGYSWPGEPREQRRIVRELGAAGLAAILFATGRFFPRIPKAILQAAERATLPILEAPSDIAFAEVTEVVNREIIRRQYQVIERSEEIHRHLTRAALEAAELADICQGLADLIRKPVAIVDARFRPLACAPGPREGSDPPRDPQWFSLERVQPVGRHDLRADLERARGPLRVRGQDEGAGRDRIVCPVRLAGQPVGYLWVLEGGDPLTDLDLRAAEHGAVVAALHILRQQAVATVEARVQNSFVQALIQGELDRITGLEERARLLGFDPDASYVVGLLALVEGGRKRALAGPEEFHLRERLHRALRLSLGESGFPALLGYLMNQVVFLLPASGDQRALRQRVAALWERVRALEPGVPCAMAMGGVSRRAPGIASSYREADSVLTASEGEGVFWYQDLLTVRLLRAVGDARVLRDLRDRTLGQLQDARQGAVLCETVRTLVRHAFNQRSAARAMKAHWNTMRHRVARIEEILGRPLSDPRLRLDLQLALEIERLYSAADPQAPSPSP